MCLRGGIRISACACVPLGVGTNTAAASVAFKKKSVVSRARRATRRVVARVGEEDDGDVEPRRSPPFGFARDSNQGLARERERGEQHERHHQRGRAAVHLRGDRRVLPPAAPADAGGCGVRVLVLGEDCARARGREHQRARRARARRERDGVAQAGPARGEDVPPEPPQLGRGEPALGKRRRARGDGGGDIRRSRRDSHAGQRGEDDDARRRRRREATTTTRGDDDDACASARAPEWPWRAPRDVGTSRVFDRFSRSNRRPLTRAGVKFGSDFARRKRETDVSALFSKRRAFESRHNPTRDA